MFLKSARAGQTTQSINNNIRVSLVSQTPICWLKQFDFTSNTGWTTTNASYLNVNTSTEVIDYNCNSSLVVLSYPLSETLSDTALVFQFKLTMTTFSASSADIQRFFVGVSDNTSNAVTANDSIGIAYRADVYGSNIQSVWGNGSSPLSNGVIFAHAPAVETIYIRIVRNSATLITVGIYSDSTFDTLIEEETDTIDSTVVSLDNIKLGTVAESTTNNIIGTIDDMKIATGVTEAPSC